MAKEVDPVEMEGVVREATAKVATTDSEAGTTDSEAETMDSAVVMPMAGKEVDRI